jgi:hypothetical protein
MMRPTVGAARLRGMRWRLSLHRERADRVPVPVAEPQPRTRLDAIQERQLGSVFEPPRPNVAVPFIGAFVSGAFAVVLALGSGGTSTALVMLVIVLLAKGMLQNVVQPPLVSAGIHIVPDIGEIQMPARAPADVGPSPPVPA